VEGRDFQATHLNVEAFGPREADQTRELMAGHNLTISALAYYENNLHPDPARREAIHRHLRHAIDAAAALAVPYVGTFVGRDWIGIDPVSTIAGHADRIVHAQAKDIEVTRGAIGRYGFFGKVVDRPDPHRTLRPLIVE
jgi:sugar phosphate isomerase/epimerase